MNDSDIKYEYPEHPVYHSLQEKTRDRLLGLSGKLWNGLYIHDPGLTINDVTNYLLSDLVYKLHFNMEDYLRTEEVELKPNRIGLFTALLNQVKSPLTSVDFQELMYSRIPEIHRIEFIPSQERKQWGTYQIQAQLYTDTPSEREEEIRQMIRSLFYRYRNLCEDLNTITFSRSDESRKPKKQYDLEAFLEDENMEYPVGTYRNVYEHIPARLEFPNFYGVNDWGLSHEASPERKRQAEQLKAYLSLFDGVIERGLEELQMLPELLLQNKTEILAKKINLKTQFLNILDKLYGVNSTSDCMLDTEGECETMGECIVRRINFLKKIYLWGRDRCKASLLNTEKKVFGIERYLSDLFGLKENEQVRLVEHTFLRYVPEKIRSDRDQPDDFPYELSLSIFLYGDTLRMKNKTFREALEITALKQIPAHLEGRVYWLDETESEVFDDLYKKYEESFKLNEQAHCGYTFSLEYAELLKEFIDRKREGL
ncbi:hypothetical protein LJB80_01080 [Bacteroides sp. OttesenSCG-928-F21]|nr:hypothetical protein [Bacteroides sp. OttesenSCG-928-F21]